MAFCAKCGASMNDGAAFCGACGTHVTNAASGTQGTNAAPSSGPQSVGMTSNVAAALAYLAGFVSGILFLAIEPYKNDSFVRFHAFQSIFLSVAYIVFSMIWRVVIGTLLGAGMGILFTLFNLVWALAELAIFLLWLFMMYKAYNNERLSLPIIGPLAAQKAGL